MKLVMLQNLKDICHAVYTTFCARYKITFLMLKNKNGMLPLHTVITTSVQKFVKSLDISDVNVIPEINGAARTVTGLTYLIIFKFKAKSIT